MLYRFLKAQAGISSLKDKNLRLGNALEFNDPYDSLLALKHSDPRVPQEFLDEAALRQRQSQFSRYGILCLTEKPQSTCIWSHYADSHTGIALGFDFQKTGDSIFKIKYLPERPSLDVSVKQSPDDHNARNHAIECLTTKSTDWTYEQEYRVILNLSDPRVFIKEVEGGNCAFISMPVQLREVILGCKCSRQDAELIREIIHSTYDWPVSIREAKLSSGNFDIIF